MSDSKSPKNALTHGFYSADIVVLNHENKQEFEELHQALLEEFKPSSPSGTIEVFDLAVLFWQKRRLDTHTQQSLNESHAHSEASASQSDWDEIARRTRAVALAQSEAAVRVSQTLQRHVERVYSPNGADAQNKDDEYEKASTTAKELEALSVASIIPILQAAEKQKLDRIGRVYSSELLEKHLKLRAELDRRIEKTLKRMVMTQQYKEFYLVDSAKSSARVIESTKQAESKTASVG